MLNIATLTSIAIKRGELASNANENVTRRAAARRLGKEMWINGEEERSHSERTTAISLIASTGIPLALVA